MKLLPSILILTTGLSVLVVVGCTRNPNTQFSECMSEYRFSCTTDAECFDESVRHIRYCRSLYQPDLSFVFDAQLKYVPDNTRGKLK